MPYSTAFLYHYPKRNCSGLFYSHILVCMYFSRVKQKQTKKESKKKKTKTSMLIWENNPLTFKFLVTSFGIAVSLYTSFSEIGLYTFNVFLTLLLFMFFPFVIFFCLFLVFFKYCPSLKALLQSDGVCSYTSKITTTTTVFDKARLLRLLRRPAQPVC